MEMYFFISSLIVFAFRAAIADGSSQNSTDLSKICNFHSVEAAEQAAEASNNFGFRLYKEIIKTNPSKNIIFSPVSISLATALLETGANGTTLHELQSALRPPGSNDSDSSELYQTLQNELHASNVEDYKINVANGLFYNENLKFKTAYVDKMTKCFRTKVAEAPFEKEPEKAREQINAWVSNETNSKIPELFKPRTITSDVVAVIANAIYFKGAWLEKFTSTQDRDFYKFGKENDTQRVPFLQRYHEYLFTSTENAGIVQIPYQNHLFSMYIILPNQRDGIQKVEQSITDGTFTSLQFSNHLVELYVPKFTTRLSFDLKKLLKQVGQNEIFTNRADFSRMSHNRLKVSSAVHEAYVKVNENGTEAAAATAFAMKPGAAPLPPQEPIILVADHPFMFAIVHRPTKAIIFIGKINYVD